MSAASNLEAFARDADEWTTADEWRDALADALQLLRSAQVQVAATPCPCCGEQRARGDASRIVYGGSCGEEWHPGDDDYPWFPGDPVGPDGYAAEVAGVTVAVTIDDNGQAGSRETDVRTVVVAVGGSAVALTWEQAEAFARGISRTVDTGRFG